MESKRLALTADTIIKLKASERDVEVPEGNFHYFLKQKNRGDRTVTFHLRHPGTEVRISGLVEAAGETAPRLTTKVIHHAPHTQAETLVRTLVHDTAKPSYEGMICIEENAQECVSYLNHHSLLLGDTAQSWTRPSLEIKADNVKCSHAATIRTITDADLFYLRSRGISATESRDILIKAFLADVQI